MSSNPYNSAFVLTRSLWEDKDQNERRDLMRQANIFVKGDGSLSSIPGEFVGWDEVLKLSDYVQLQEQRVAHGGHMSSKADPYSNEFLDHTSVPQVKVRTAPKDGNQPYSVAPSQKSVQTSLEDLFKRQKEMRMNQEAFLAAEFPSSKQPSMKKAFVSSDAKPPVFCLNILNVPIASDLVNLYVCVI